MLDEPLAQLCEQTRLLDFIYNFVVFDDGQKKMPRLHQYEGIKAAQARIRKREGGVIWHTQGSGKSIYDACHYYRLFKETNFGSY